MTDVTDLTVNSVISYLRNNSATADELPQLIQTIGQSWQQAMSPPAAEPEPVTGQRRSRRSKPQEETAVDVSNQDQDTDTVEGDEEQGTLQEQLQGEYEGEQQRPEPMFED